MAELREPATVLVAKYFVFAGGMLLALLFAIDWLLPDPPVIFPDRPQIDETIIRIASAHKWPEADASLRAEQSAWPRHSFTPPAPHARFAGSSAVAVQRRAGRRGACGRDQQSPFAGR